MPKDVKRHGTGKASARAAAPRAAREPAIAANQFDVLTVVDNVLRTLPVALVVVDQRARLVLANDRALELFNARRADLVHRPLADLLPGAVLTATVDPAGAAQARLDVEGGDAPTARRVDGIRFPTRVEVHPWKLRDGVLVALAFAVAETAAGAADAASERDALLRVVLSGMPAMVSVKDRHGRYLLVNDYQAEVLGVGPETAIGRTTSELIGSDTGSAIDALDRQMATGAGLFFTVEETIRDRDGRDSVWLTTKSALRDSNGEIDKVFSVSIDISEKKLLEERASSLVNYDALTGLPNRPLLMRRIHEAVGHAKRARSRVAVIVIDIDNLKEIEAAEGEGAADHILRRAAIRLSSTIRETDAVARPGNESFAILLNQVAAAEDALAEADRFATSLAEPFQLRDSIVGLRVNHGVAVYPDDGRDEHELMEAADIAINRSRRRGRRAQQPEQASSEDQSRRRALHAGLRGALEHGQLAMVLLPEIDLGSGRIVRAEALARWDHPEHGAVEPEEFLQFAETSDLMDAFTEWSLRTACEAAAHWSEGPLSGLVVTVNLSASQFFYPDLTDLIADTLDQSALDPSRIAIEVEELAAMQDPDLAANVIAELAESGIATSLDRFGAHATSLAFVESLRATSLKIDRSLMTAGPDKAVLFRAAAALGGSLGKRMVATGIETADQLRLARSAGCAGGQGFLLSRPLPAEDFGRLVRSGAGTVHLPD